MSEREERQDRLPALLSDSQLSRRRLFGFFKAVLIKPDPRAIQMLNNLGAIAEPLAKEVMQNVLQQPLADIIQETASLDAGEIRTSWEILMAKKYKPSVLDEEAVGYDGFTDEDFFSIFPKLKDVQTIDELVELIGPLTPEEQAMLADPHLHDDPTPEELAFMGDDFIERIQDRVRDRINQSPH